MGDISSVDWEAQVARHFGFLSDRFHMVITDRDDSRWWATSITYARDQVAIIICRRLDLARTEVELARMVDGGIPSLPLFIHEDTPIDRCDLGQLLMLCAPSESEVLDNLGGLDPESVEVSLAFQAKALERYGKDLLQGDLAVFQDLDRLIKNRLAQSPPQIMVSMPNGGSHEEIQRLVELAARLDPRVPVKVNLSRRWWLPWKWPWNGSAS